MFGLFEFLEPIIEDAHNHHVTPTNRVCRGWVLDFRPTVQLSNCVRVRVALYAVVTPRQGTRH